MPEDRLSLLAYKTRSDPSVKWGTVPTTRQSTFQFNNRRFITFCLVYLDSIFYRSAFLNRIQILFAVQTRLVWQELPIKCQQYAVTTPDSTVIFNIKSHFQMQILKNWISILVYLTFPNDTSTITMQFNLGQSTVTPNWNIAITTLPCGARELGINQFI